MHIMANEASVNSLPLMAEASGVESTTSAKKSLCEHSCFADPAFRADMERIMLSHSRFRECIRDGNCLYTSYAIALGDLVDGRMDLVEALETAFEDVNAGLQTQGVNELGYSGFHESFVEILRDIASGSARIEDIPLFSWYDCVAYLRLAVSSEMKRNPDMYLPYIPDTDVDRYCAMFVDPFYKDAGCVEICALSNRIPIGIHVVDLGRNGQTDAYGSQSAFVCIFYTHNHFEPIYEHE